MVMEIETYNQMMKLADTLYALPESRVVHMPSREMLATLEGGGEGGLRDIKFNMALVYKKVHGCGIVCCAIGWGDALFPGEFQPAGPYGWLYSSSWADIPGADGPKEAAHRIWYWIAEGCPRSGARLPNIYSADEWSAFAEQWPLEECRSRALAFGTKDGIDVA